MRPRGSQFGVLQQAAQSDARNTDVDQTILFMRDVSINHYQIYGSVRDDAYLLGFDALAAGSGLLAVAVE
jgi:hypothetical protein